MGPTRTLSDRWTKGNLLPANRELVSVMQRLQFGRIEGLDIRNGEPILDTARIIREIKLGSEQVPNILAEQSDFELKGQVVELFEQFMEIRDGSIELIEIRHGLPFRLVIEQSVQRK